MDKSRQQFEEAIAKIYKIPAENISEYRTYDRYMDCMVFLNESWVIWQASRESLEVELPDGFGVHEVWCYTAVSVEQALISNGVKIKNE